MTTIERGRHPLSVALLILAIVIGGSIQAPLFLLVVQLTAVALIVAMVATLHWPAGRDAGVTLILLALAALLPLLQLVPLPFAFWAALPGRDVAVDTMHAAGIAIGAHALTLDPHATSRSAIALLPPIAIFLATIATPMRQRRTLVLIGAGGAVASALLGALQLTVGASFDLYQAANHGDLIGFFAYRNAEADLLMVGMLLAAGWAAGETRYQEQARLAAIGVAPLLAAAVIVTTSRMGMLLLPVTLGGMLAVLLPPGARRWRHMLGGLALLLILLVALIWLNPVAGRTAARFLSAADDGRSQFWRTTVTAIRAYWPVGSGLGTFVPVFQTFEPLETLSTRYVNNAHNDYLQILLEAGLPGAALMAAGLALLAWRAARAPQPPRERALHRTAALGILVLLLHSLVDYPLRTTTLATMFGLLAGLLFPPPPDDRSKRRRRSPQTVTELSHY